LGTRESNIFFFGCKFDPKKQLLDANDVIGGKYVINGEYWKTLETRIHIKCIIMVIIWNPTWSPTLDVKLCYITVELFVIKTVETTVSYSDIDRCMK
jgi:hypothetical protein